MIRSGEFAEIAGVTYPCRYVAPDYRVVIKSKAPANPDPTLFAWHERFDGWVADIPAGYCDRVYAAQSYARYLGHRVAIDNITGETASVHYADENGAWAVENGFAQADKYEYTKDIPLTDLRDRYEEQRDLKFLKWSAAFPAPQADSPAGQRP